jgi:hypothetical protein
VPRIECENALPPLEHIMDFQPSFALFCALGSSVFAACIVLALVVEMIDHRILKRQARPARVAHDTRSAPKEQNGPQLYL